jgi:hypothetical protein
VLIFLLEFSDVVLLDVAMKALLDPFSFWSGQITD